MTKEQYMKQIQRAKDACPEQVKALEAAKAKLRAFELKREETIGAGLQLKEKHSLVTIQKQMVEGVEIETEVDEHRKTLGLVNSTVGALEQKIERQVLVVRDCERDLHMAVMHKLKPLRAELEDRFQQMADEADSLARDLEVYWRAVGSSYLDPDGDTSIWAQLFIAQLGTVRYLRAGADRSGAGRTAYDKRHDVPTPTPSGPMAAMSAARSHEAPLLKRLGSFFSVYKGSYVA